MINLGIEVIAVLALVAGALIATLVLWFVFRGREQRKLTVANDLSQVKQLELQQALQQLELDSKDIQQRLELEKSELQKHLALEKQKSANQQIHIEEQKQQLQQQMKQMQVQFENLANRIFESRQQQFQQQSKQTLDSSLKPLSAQLEQFRKRIDDVHSKDITDRTQLKSYIEQLQQKTEKMSTDALNLSKALKGDNKLQGNWGEMLLERLLEDSGLVKGVEYSLQASYQSDTNNRLQPDAIIHLPENKALIIDSKVSLVHYENYYNSTDATVKAQSLKLHVQSIREHFKGLSNKRYQAIEQLQTVDFVFMFIPIEPAYLLALQEQPSIFTEAFDANVTLVSHTTLMPMLRTVNMLWRTEKQNRNAMEIASQAGKLYDKFVGMLSSLSNVGTQLEKAQKAYDETRNRLSDGRGNLLKQTEKLKLMGAKTQSQLPENYQKEIELYEDDE